MQAMNSFLAVQMERHFAAMYQEMKQLILKIPAGTKLEQSSSYSDVAEELEGHATHFHLFKNICTSLTFWTVISLI